MNFLKINSNFFFSFKVSAMRGLHSSHSWFTPMWSKKSKGWWLIPNPSPWYIWRKHVRLILLLILFFFILQLRIYLPFISAFSHSFEALILHHCFYLFSISIKNHICLWFLYSLSSEVFFVFVSNIYEKLKLSCEFWS